MPTFPIFTLLYSFSLFSYFSFLLSLSPIFSLHLHKAAKMAEKEQTSLTLFSVSHRLSLSPPVVTDINRRKKRKKTRRGCTNLLVSVCPDQSFISHFACVRVHHWHTHFACVLISIMFVHINTSKTSITSVKVDHVHEQERNERVRNDRVHEHVHRTRTITVVLVGWWRQAWCCSPAVAMTAAVRERELLFWLY